MTKYTNKGSDQATFTLARENDEVYKYETGRYISTSEATWRVLSFDIHEHFPAVEHLSVHVENGQWVYFKTTANIEKILNQPPTITLTGFFDLCKEDTFAKTLLYHEVPSYYKWDKKRFVRRKQGEPVPGIPGIRKGSAIERVYNLFFFDCFIISIPEKGASDVSISM